MTSAELDKLAFRFFKLFAQCEYALKAMGYGRAAAKGVAEADWDRFANERAAGVMRVEDPQVVAARTYLSLWLFWRHSSKATMISKRPFKAMRRDAWGHLSVKQRT